MARFDRDQRTGALIWSLVIATAFAASAFFGAALFRVFRGPAGEALGTPAGGGGAARVAGGPAPAAMAELASATLHVSALSGARVAAPGGVGGLTLPPGALASDTDVTVRLVAADGAADGFPLALDLQPDGLQLARRAQLAFTLPPGVPAEAVEVAVYDPSAEAWVPEESQAIGPGGRTLVASIAHFSFRRLRIRPGMNLPFDPARAAASFTLAADLANAFEARGANGWQPVSRTAPGFKGLVRAGRFGRNELITSGRLRAVAQRSTEHAVLSDAEPTIELPRGARVAHSGWVSVTRLDRDGLPEGTPVVCRVTGETPAELVAAGLSARLSRRAMEALGLEWGRDFGVDPDEPEGKWIARRGLPAGDDAGSVAVRIAPAEQPGR